MAKKPPAKRVALAALDWIAAQRKTGSRTAAREALAFATGETVEGPVRDGPAPRDTRHAIQLGFSMQAILELKRRGVIWS